jgi:hypothetical protein
LLKERQTFTLQILLHDSGGIEHISIFLSSSSFNLASRSYEGPYWWAWGSVQEDAVYRTYRAVDPSQNPNKRPKIRLQITAKIRTKRMQHQLDYRSSSYEAMKDLTGGPAEACERTPSTGHIVQRIPLKIQTKDQKLDCRSLLKLEQKECNIN